MTDAPFDELASAHLDGTTSPEEAARVAADPALLARVEELRAVRAALNVLPPVDAAQREAAIAAALAAFAEGDPAHGADGGEDRGRVTAVSPIAARRGPSPRTLRVVGAAAAAVLLAALVPLLGGLGRSGDDDSAATSSQDVVEESGSALGGDDGGRESAPEAGSSADAPTTTSSSVPVDLGRFDDLAALVAATVDRDVTDESEGLADFLPADGGDGCLSERTADALAQGAQTVDAATATVDDEAVVVLIVTSPDGTRVLRVFLADGCVLQVERSL